MTFDEYNPSSTLRFHLSKTFSVSEEAHSKRPESESTGCLTISFEIATRHVAFTEYSCPQNVPHMLSMLTITILCFTMVFLISVEEAEEECFTVQERVDETALT